MPRLRSLLLSLPLLVTATVALVLPSLAGTPAGKGGSVVAKAAQADGTPGGDQRYPIGSPEIEAAKATAIAYWGANPCGGDYAMAWTALDLGTNATASWRNPTDAWNNAGANFDCKIDINPAADYDYPKLCTVLTHEIGHLLGQQHDANPGQLMSAYYTGPIPQCEQASPPPTAPGTSDQAYGEADGIDIVARDEPRKATLSKKTTKSTKKVKRCKVVKKKSGKRVKRCVTVRAKKAAKR